MPKVGAAKPAAPRVRKSTAQKRAEDRQEDRREAAQETHVPQDSDSETKVPAEEQPDWSAKPDYADNPGDVDFDNLDEVDDFIRVLYWGTEGTAKSTSIADMVNMKPGGQVLIVNAEGGLRKTALRQRGIDTANIRIWPKQGEPLTFEGLERLYYRIAADLDEDPLSWLGVSWDSDTTIYQSMLDNLIEADRQKAEAILKRAGRGKSGRAGNITLPDRFESDQTDYYNRMSQQFRLLMRKWHTLDCHFAMTALLRRDEDKRTHKVTYGPAVSPALSTDVRARADIVVQTFASETNAGIIWWGRTHPTEDSAGKDRFGVLPHRMVEPTMSRIQAYVLGDLTEDEDPLQVQFGSYLETAEKEAKATQEQSKGKPARRAAGPKPARKSAASKTEDAADEIPDDQAQAEEAPSESEKPTRRVARRPAARTASKPAEDKGEPEKPTKPAARRTATRKAADPKQAAARAAVKAETDEKKGGPASARAKARARTAQKQQKVQYDSGKPPF